MDDSWDWVYEIINKPIENKPELPEDIIFHMLKKNKTLQELIDRFDCELEM